MRNTHIAFISYPQHPHVGPTLPIASALIRRGWRVTYATSDRFRQRVEALGAEVVPYTSAPTYTPPDLRGEEKWKHEDTFAALAHATLEQVTSFYDRDRPALILYDLGAFAGRILARKWNIPAIKTSPSFALTRRAFERQVPDADFRRVMLEYSGQVGRFYEQHGAPCTDEWIFDGEKLNLYLFPKALQPCADSTDETCFFAGRCAGEQAYYGHWTRRTDRPIALVSTSTMYTRGPEFFRMCIDALADLPWHLILSIGDKGDPALLGPLPPNVEVVQHTAHVRILPFVSLFVCLGGIITSAEAAYHGVPLILTTHGFPELEWQAANLERLGVGAHLDKATLSAESLRRTAIEVSKNATMRQAVGQMRHRVRREPGAEETANRIEEYLETFAA